MFMPRWDAQLVKSLTERDFKVVGVGSTEPYDVLCLTDGPPVSPLYYGQRRIAELKCDLLRDMEETRLLRSMGAAKPKVGFGRGAHMLNIFNGGSAWQVTSGMHLGPTLHKAVSWVTGTSQYITTNHVQVMVPHDSADILAVATNPSTKYQSDKATYTLKEMVEAIDVESCYYPHSNSLCFQPTDLSHAATMNLFIELFDDNTRLPRT
jgi:gamma-glutamyl-gamma-aminobutyrate hydrolase PuuD